MGFDVNRFVNCSEINEDLICNICKGVLEEAVWAPNCEHAFCKVCINKWLLRRNICPNDRQHLNHSHLRAIPRFMRNILDKLEIKCEFVSNGCQQTISLESLEQHISGCDFNPEKRVECQSGCGLVIKKADLQSHNCVKDLRKKVDVLVEENLKYDRIITSFRLDINSLRNENNRINDSVNSLRNEVKRLTERQTSVINDGSPISQTNSIAVKTERHSRVVPNPYVLITPLQSSSSLATSDEPSSSTFVTTATRLSNNEPVFKRRTTIRVASPLSDNRPITSTISSSFVRSYSPPLYSSTREDSYLSGTPSPHFISNVTTLSPSNDSVSQDEESTTAVTIGDGYNNPYNYITLDAEQDFDDNDETEAEEDNTSIEQISEYENDIQVTVD